MAAEFGRDILGSARVFAVAVRKVFEEGVLREVAGDSLNFSQLKLLYLVAQTERNTISDAAAFLGVSKAAASKSVDKLVRRKLLNRIEIEADRRSTQLSLTEASRQLLTAYEGARNRLAEKIFSPFTPEELESASDLLDRLASAVVTCSANPGEICMQCSIYFRENCRFGNVGQQACLYSRHKGHKADAPEKLRHPSDTPRVPVPPWAEGLPATDSREQSPGLPGAPEVAGLTSRQSPEPETDSHLRGAGVVSVEDTGPPSEASPRDGGPLPVGGGAPPSPGD